MQLVTVDSSMVHAIGYDADNEELEVIFTSGRIYRYQEVSKEVYDSLLASESKGRFMRSNIIDLYPYYELRQSRKR